MGANLKKWLKPAYIWFLSLLPLRARVIFGYVINHGRWPNIDSPQTLNEKIIWRKLHDRDPRLPELVDKIKVKQIIAARYGESLIIPTLQVYDTAGEIDFAKLPIPSVIKVNHASKTNIFLRSKDDLAQPEALRSKLAGYLKYDHGATRGEWAYTQVARKILVEPLIKMSIEDVVDFRFHVFQGVVYLIEVTIDSSGNLRSAFYDKNWNQITNIRWGCPRYEKSFLRPQNLEAMIELAQSIGRDFSYVRVDLYEVDGAVKFSELTFYPGAGHDPFVTRHWDYEFGKYWKLTSS